MLTSLPLIEDYPLGSLSVPRDNCAGRAGSSGDELRKENSHHGVVGAAQCPPSPCCAALAGAGLEAKTKRFLVNEQLILCLEQVALQSCSW